MAKDQSLHNYLAKSSMSLISSFKTLIKLLCREMLLLVILKCYYNSKYHVFVDIKKAKMINNAVLSLIWMMLRIALT